MSQWKARLGEGRTPGTPKEEVYPVGEKTAIQDQLERHLFVYVGGVSTPFLKVCKQRAGPVRSQVDQKQAGLGFLKPP